MAKTFDLSSYSEDELTHLIDEATSVRHTLRESLAREGTADKVGNKGQDVHNPDHGVIPVPTPREVEEVGPAHGVGK